MMVVRHVVLILGILVGVGCWADPIRIVSYNICHGEGMDGRVDLARTARLIRSQHPRFAAIQEVDVRTRRVGGVDEAAELGRLTGLVPTFARAIDFQGGQYGILLLSQEKPLAVRRVALPGSEPRVLLLAEFDDCWVGCTHLSVSETEAREASVRLIREAVEGLPKPVFLAGDWNSLKESPVLKGLGEFLTVLSDTTKRTFHGRASQGPSGLVDDFCIDYIAVTKRHESDFNVVERAVVEDRETSDHAPIVVSVERVNSKK